LALYFLLGGQSIYKENVNNWARNPVSSTSLNIASPKNLFDDFFYRHHLSFVGQTPKIRLWRIEYLYNYISYFGQPSFFVEKFHHTMPAATRGVSSSHIYVRSNVQILYLNGEVNWDTELGGIWLWSGRCVFRSWGYKEPGVGCGTWAVDSWYAGEERCKLYVLL
jgi:hypothetical protein